MSVGGGEEGEGEIDLLVVVIAEREGGRSG